MRASIPALVVLAMAAASVLSSPARALQRRVYWPILLVLLLGVPTAVMEMTRAVQEPAWKPDYSKSLVPDPAAEYPAHYVTRLTGSFVDRLLRPVGNVNAAEPAGPRRLEEQYEMKAVILAGGIGSRLTEETVVRPKPMVEIGGKPILWHIMKIYSAHGINDFVICLGYKGYLIKEYFANYFLHMSDVTFDMIATTRSRSIERHAEPWRVTLVDTGDTTQTGGRLKRVGSYVRGRATSA